MLDMRFIRENPGVVRDGARAKNISIDLDALLELDDHGLGGRGIMFNSQRGIGGIRRGDFGGH